MRYYYSCVGYGVFSLLGEIYRMGRIEVFDSEEDSGYPVHEGFFCLPFEASRKLEDLLEELETDFPIHLTIGSMDWCREAASEYLGVHKDKLNDTETMQKYYLDKYIKEHGCTPEEHWNKIKPKEE